MNIFINVATREKSIVLYNDASVVDLLTWNDSGKESEHVLPGIVRLLEKNNLRFENISAMTVVHGPGAFTGLRVVVSVVNTIQFVHSTISISALSVGEVYSTIDKANHEQYLFQIYPADAFLFARDGAFIQRIPEAELTENMCSHTAGEMITDICAIATIPSVKEWHVQDFQNLQEKSTLTQGILVPFYAKEPNITTRKKS